MKLIIREYLASLRERDELDAILPEILSELGYVVISKPGRGTTQHGVDIAAVGVDEDGEKKMFLFSIKQGDLDRASWDGSQQAIRPSLNEIRDVYIATKIPQMYRKLNVVICICMGGDIKEQVRAALTGYEKENTTSRISFAEWNGDKLAELVLKGVLKEKLLPEDLRSFFRKSIAMIDEPDVSYLHFSKLTKRIIANAEENEKYQVTAARQIYICLWVMFVWARQVENIEAPYRASEWAIICTWSMVRKQFGNQTTTKTRKLALGVLDQLIKLHLLIAMEYLEKKIFPYVNKRHALSTAVRSQSSLDVNLKLFEVLGRIGLTGLWLHWLGEKDKENFGDVAITKCRDYALSGLQLIKNNPSLNLPVTDQQNTNICLFLQLAMEVRESHFEASKWLSEIAKRYDFSMRTQGKYPTVYSEYRDLVDHPRTQTDAYFKEATSASVLLPILSSWMWVLGAKEELRLLVKLKDEKLEHCTMQIWMPDAQSEELIYTVGNGHGAALVDLKISENGASLLETIVAECKRQTGFEQLSAIKIGAWPIVLLACKHNHLPIPPQFWAEALLVNGSANDEIDNVIPVN
jgi:hypothetical protein